MRYAVFSDVHSNLEALEAVLSAVAKDGVDQLLCAGDLVGYGIDPTVCLTRIQENRTRVVGGNHDRAVVGQMPIDWFNEPAQAALLWTRNRLPQEEQDFLRGLPLIWQDEEVTLVHGSLHEPEKFHYLFDLDQAEASLRLQKTLVAFVGHTHVPGFFIQDGARIFYDRSQRISINPAFKYVVNVGSVGQPRDGDVRAAYCLYDTAARSLEFRRVPYPIEQTQAKIRRAGLPGLFAERLAYGY